MSSFQDLYELAAADKSRGMQFHAIQEIRRGAIRELKNAGVYTEPEDDGSMTDEELAARRAEAAYAYGLQSILESSKLPNQEGNESYAVAVRDTSTKPYCIALCIQTKLEELRAQGAERNSKTRPVYYVICANPELSETVDPLKQTMDILRMAYPNWNILLSERDPKEEAQRALAENLRQIIERNQKDQSDENSQQLAAALLATPLYFPAERPEKQPENAKEGEVHLQFGKARSESGKAYFLAFTDRAQMFKWKQMGCVELGFKEYSELVLHSQDAGIVVDPYVGANLCLTREMLQSLQSQYEMMNSLLNSMAEAGFDPMNFDPSKMEPPIEQEQGYQPQKPKVNEWWKKDK